MKKIEYATFYVRIRVDNAVVDTATVARSNVSIKDIAVAAANNALEHEGVSARATSRARSEFPNNEAGWMVHGGGQFNLGISRVSALDALQWFVVSEGEAAKYKVKRSTLKFDFRYVGDANSLDAAATVDSAKSDNSANNDNSTEPEDKEAA